MLAGEFGRRLCEEGHSYASEARAVTQLSATMQSLDRHFRWVVVVNSKGRFVPCVILGQEDYLYLNALVHNKISVIS